MLASLISITIALSPSLVHTVHAATGTVCLADPASNFGSMAPCPSSPALFDGPQGQQIRIGVFVQGSDGFNGFSITMLANHTFLKPAGVELTGTVLVGNYHPVLECLSGVLILGNICSSTDTVDTLRFDAFSGLGTGNTPNPTTGLLFTAIYNITGTVAQGSSIPVGFQTGCSFTSVSPNICVTLANGSTTPSLETVQDGSFDNSASSTMPLIALSTSKDSLGPQFPGAVDSLTVTATALNGFPGNATDMVTFTAQAPPGVTVTITGSNSCSTLGTSCNVTISASSTARGNFQLFILAIYSPFDAKGNPETLVAAATISLTVWDFSLDLGSSAISVVSGTTVTDSVKVESQNGFSGQIAFSTGNSFPSGLNAALNPPNAALQPDGMVTSTLSVAAPKNVTGIYRVPLRATSGGQVKTVTVAVTVSAGGVPGFNLSADTSNILVPPNYFATSNLIVTSINGFSSLVSLNATASVPLTTSIRPQNVTGSGNVTLTVSSISEGNFTVQVIGQSGSLTRSITVHVQVTSTPVGKVCIVPSETVSCPATPAPVTAQVGAQVRISVLISNSAPFDAFDITLLADHNILRPVSADIYGTVLPGPAYIGNECIGGVRIQGGAICSPQDTVDTIEVTAIARAGSFTPALTNGLLFTATYNVTGPTKGTEISFQTCAGPTSTPPLCVDIVNGKFTAPVQETDPGAVFTTSTAPDFVLTADSPALKVVAGSETSSPIFLTTFNGFTGPVSVTGIVSPLVGIIATIDPTSITAGQGASNLTITTTTATPPGTYTVTVTGTASSAGPHTTTIKVIVEPLPFKAADPQLFQLQYTHRLVFAASNGTDNFLTGVYNPNNSTALYFQIEIKAISDDGITRYDATSAVIAVAPQAKMGNIVVLLTFKASDIGHTFNFTLTINWGASPNSLLFTSHDIANFSGNAHKSISVNGSIIVMGPHRRDTVS